MAIIMRIIIIINNNYNNNNNNRWDRSITGGILVSDCSGGGSRKWYEK